MPFNSRFRCSKAYRAIPLIDHVNTLKPSKFTYLNTLVYIIYLNFKTYLKYLMALLLSMQERYMKKRPGFRCAEFLSSCIFRGNFKMLFFSLLNDRQIEQLVSSIPNEDYHTLVEITRNDIATSQRYSLRMS